MHEGFGEDRIGLEPVVPEPLNPPTREPVEIDPAANQFDEQRIREGSGRPPTPRRRGEHGGRPIGARRIMERQWVDGGKGPCGEPRADHGSHEKPLTPCDLCGSSERFGESHEVRGK